MTAKRIAAFTWGEGLDLVADLPPWYRPKGQKTKYDFPRAKSGRPDRHDYLIGEVKAGKPRRLDKHMLERYPGYSRSFLQKLIKDERVLLNGKPTRSSWHVTPGERITVLLPPGTEYEAEVIPFDVLFEDEHLIALNKPPGIIVHPARGRKTGTMYHGLLHYYRERIATDPSFRVRTVHRLDEETSGVIVFPLNHKCNQDITMQFEQRLLKKTYVCLVHGVPDFDAHDMDAPIGIDPSNRTRSVVGGLDAREAQTRFTCLARSPCGNFGLLRCFPRTGRGHQIRVHAAALGHPIVGDELYGGLRAHEKFDGLEARVFLHAESLELTHPAKRLPLLLKAPLYADLITLLEKVGLTQSTA